MGIKLNFLRERYDYNTQKKHITESNLTLSENWNYIKIP